ncbi:MAG TPA: HlyD family efflux transporter periplasmic adaptor subunit, partial [Burkholderiales bacterium]|nr:HlyD family efflux transporter periplasmic adaptor subunit [Burkholderiales bacterium]
INVVAPFSGRVVYRDPSPTTVAMQAPIAVLAPPDGVRVKIRMPSRQAALLEDAGTVHLRLPRTYHADREERQFMERRFTGRLLTRTPLAHDSGVVLAELAATPPAEAVREMLAGRQIIAQLLWTPPLLSMPAFAAGGAIAALGCMWLLLLHVARRPLLSRAPAGEPAPAPDTINLPVDHGMSLRALGAEIRNLIAERRADEKTLAAAEWALDRYQVRAVRLLSAGVALDAAACAQLDAWAQEVVASADESDEQEFEEALRGVQRLTRLLGSIAAERYQPALRRVAAVLAASRSGSLANAQ